MNDLKSLSAEALVSKTHALVKEERKLTLEILHYLRVIEQRRIYAERGYSSLYEMCLKEFGYSEGAAYRRISAMRVLKECPEVESKIESGVLTLSTVSTLGGFFQSEKIETEQKRELLTQAEGLSRRETERLIRTLAPEARSSDRERILDAETVELRFTVSQKLLAKLQKIRALTSHQNPNPSYEELLDKMANLAIAQLEKKKGLTQLPSPSPAKVNSRRDFTSRFIPVTLKRRIYSRDQGQCTYRDPATNRRCASQFLLEFDHITPYARGGLPTEENLRLLCKAHNQLRAVRVFGEAKTGA